MGCTCTVLSLKRSPGICSNKNSCTLNRVHFDPIQLMPTTTYLRQFVDQADREFPEIGYSASVYTGRLGYSVGEFESVNSVADGMRDLAEAGTYLTGAEMWWLDFKDFLNSTHGIADWRDVFEHDDGEGRGQHRSFPRHLSDFLHHAEGGKSKHSFKFADELVCDEPAPEIKVLIGRERVKGGTDQPRPSVSVDEAREVGLRSGVLKGATRTGQGRREQGDRGRRAALQDVHRQHGEFARSVLDLLMVPDIN